MTEATMTTGVKPLRQRIMSAGSWALIGYGTAQVLRLGSSLVMTRLLAPELFGLMALTMSIALVVSLLADIGVRQAVIQSKRGDTPAMLDTAWTMQIARGWVVWLVCCVVAFVIDRLRAHGFFDAHSVYAASQLPWVIVAVTFMTVIQGYASTKLMLADRTLELKRASMIEVIGLVVTIATMVALAVQWKSVWPLVIGTLAGSVVSTVLSHVWLHGHRDRMRWDRDCAHEIMRIGRWILASSALFVLSSNGDRLMLGAWATKEQLAYYYIALTLAQAVELAASRVTLSVAVPAFSEVVRRGTGDLPSKFWKLRIPLDAAMLGVAGLLFALGPTIVRALYDVRYHDAGHILQILSCTLIAARYGVSISAYIAMGTTKYLSIINFAKLIALVIALPLGYRLGGLEGAYWAIALHQLALLPFYYYFNHRHGLWHWGKELMLVVAWPTGWALGWLVAHVLARWLG